MNSLSINESSVQDLAGKGLLKEFAYFLYLKSLYGNSCIFNYTQESLAAKANLPVSAIRKHVRVFINRGWCRIHRGNLVFLKVNSFLKSTTKVYVKFQISNNVKELYDDLSLMLLKIKQRQFDRYVKLKARLNNWNPKVRKAAMVYMDKFGIKERDLPSESDKLKMSMKSIAAYLGVSVGSAAGLIKRLRVDRRIVCVPSRTEVFWTWSKGCLKAKLEHTPNSYLSNGALFIVSCNSYVF